MTAAQKRTKTTASQGETKAAKLAMDVNTTVHVCCRISIAVLTPAPAPALAFDLDLDLGS
ncbi:hypothetical protein [Dyella silvatica]|uniref:hypothetical protein n=1 Tax=Dyella silvatica TaxID=2992128 RepID=UPI00224E00EE|nr:hypothetical protein [Dyella silvatica]